MQISVGNAWGLTKTTGAEKIELSFVLFLIFSDTYHPTPQQLPSCHGLKVQSKRQSLGFSLLLCSLLCEYSFTACSWASEPVHFPSGFCQAAALMHPRRFSFWWAQAEMAKHFLILISLLVGGKEMDSWDESLELIRSQRQVCNIDDSNTLKIA